MCVCVHICESYVWGEKAVRGGGSADNSTGILILYRAANEWSKQTFVFLNGLCTGLLQAVAYASFICIFI